MPVHSLFISFCSLSTLDLFLSKLPTFSPVVVYLATHSFPPPLSSYAILQSMYIHNVLFAQLSSLLLTSC